MALGHSHHDRRALRREKAGKMGRAFWESERQGEAQWKGAECAPGPGAQGLELQAKGSRLLESPMPHSGLALCFIYAVPLFMMLPSLSPHIKPSKSICPGHYQTAPQALYIASHLLQLTP